VSRTSYYCASSLDGFIAESDDTIDWLTRYRGSFDGPGAEPGGRGNYERFYEGVGALVMGSVTYAFVLGELSGGGDWPYRDKPAWVLTSRQLPVPEGDGVDVRLAEAAVSELHDEMLAAAGERDLWVVGGGNVASQFADAGVLDDVIVTVVPVVLGHGKPLFDRQLPGGAMHLIRTRTFDSGMVELHYAIRPG
jgi:dihydrofolate reductase